MKTRLQVVCAVALWVTHSAAADPDWPEALRRAAEAHSPARLRTARVEYLVRELPGQEGRETLRCYTFRGAGEDVAQTYYGDGAGIVFRAPEGGVTQFEYLGPQHMLQRPGEMWSRPENGAVATVHEGELPGGLRAWDLRYFGINPGNHSQPLGTADAAIAAAGLPPLEYRQELVDGLYVVTAENADTVSRWWIDPQRDWCIVKTEVHLFGHQAGEVRFKLKQIDGYWFPIEQEFTKHYPDGRTEIAQSIQVLEAEFNRADHPQSLGPAEIGVEVGSIVNYVSRGQPGYYWDGTEGIPAEEFVAREQRGELRRSPRAVALLALLVRNGDPETQPAADLACESPADLRRRCETEWEIYTRQFIVKHRLDQAQAQRAWSILRDCQERAQNFLTRKRSECDEATRELHAALMLSGGVDRERAINELKPKLERLSLPIEKIFEKELKPRLDRLPSAKQRRAATQPSPAHAP